MTQVTQRISDYIDNPPRVRGIDMAFGKLLVEDFGVDSHPKASLLFKIAWGQGHSYGLREVLYSFVEMLPLIQD